MFYNLKESSLQLDNTSLDYAVFGKGAKPLVIIPGLTLRDVKGAGWSLAYMYRIFAKDYRVYVFDKKKVITEECTIKNLADDLAHAMKQLEIQNAHIFGVSQGGMVAQYLALDYPELVDKVVLGVTLSRNNPTVEAVIANWVRLSEQNDFEGIVADMMEIMYSESYVKKYRWLFTILTKISKPKDMSRFMTLAKACLTCDAYERLKSITCPVFVLGGKQDQIVTGEASAEIAEKLNCELYMYEQYGHSAYEEAADFNKRIFDFLGDK